jgi:hypothetical protein
MAKFVLAILMLCVGFGVMPLAAGFRSPESLVRNVYAYYGKGSPGFSGGLPHDSGTASRFFRFQAANRLGFVEGASL